MTTVTESPDTFVPEDIVSFSSFEIEPVTYVNGSDDVAPLTAVEEAGREEIAFWTLYGRLPNGMVKAIADQSSMVDCRILYHRLFGDSSEENLRIYVPESA